MVSQRYSETGVGTCVSRLPWSMQELMGSVLGSTRCCTCLIPVFEAGKEFR